MFVPNLSHTTVVNKTIVYSDTVLPLKDIGKNLKVTCIKDVSEYFLENCLKIIFESNPNVIFNTIQYSKNDQQVYFYTNQEISTKEYEESKIFKYKPISSRSEILEEVKTILTSDKIKNIDCISLYDVANLMYRTNHKYETIKDNYSEYCEDIVKSKFGTSTSLVIYDFDYDDNELEIGFKYFGNEYKDITFGKKDGDLFILKSESPWAKEVLTEIGVKLSELYDEFINFTDYKKEKSYGINPVNSNFLVDISSYGVDIFTNQSTNRYIKEFKLGFPSYSDEYKYDCNSTTVISALKGNEKEIFKRIFVKINDCPEWCQAILSGFRQNQLAEEQKIADELKAKEMKKQKRLELTRKLFPFFKR